MYCVSSQCEHQHLQATVELSLGNTAYKVWCEDCMRKVEFNTSVWWVPRPENVVSLLTTVFGENGEQFGVELVGGLKDDERSKESGRATSGD